MAVGGASSTLAGAAAGPSTASGRVDVGVAPARASVSRPDETIRVAAHERQRRTAVTRRRGRGRPARAPGARRRTRPRWTAASTSPAVARRRRRSSSELVVGSTGSRGHRRRRSRASLPGRVPQPDRRRVGVTERPPVAPSRSRGAAGGIDSHAVAPALDRGRGPTAGMSNSVGRRRRRRGGIGRPDGGPGHAREQHVDGSVPARAIARSARRRASVGRPRAAAASAATMRASNGPSSSSCEEPRRGLAGAGEVAGPPADLGEVDQAVVVERVAPGQRLELGPGQGQDPRRRWRRARTRSGSRWRSAARVDRRRDQAGRRRCRSRPRR